jgi:hypothetical protein
LTEGISLSQAECPKDEIVITTFIHSTLQVNLCFSKKKNSNYAFSLTGIFMKYDEVLNNPSFARSRFSYIYLIPARHVPCYVDFLLASRVALCMCNDTNSSKSAFV